MPTKPWEDPQFSALFSYNQFYTPAQATLRDKNFPSRDERDFADILYSADDEMSTEEKKAHMQGLEGYQVVGGAQGSVTGNNSFAIGHDIIGTKEAAEDIFRKGEDLTAALRKEAAKSSYSHVKRYYEDMADICDRKKGNLTQMEMTSPYLKNMLDTMVELTNPGREEIQEQRDMLGKPLYDSTFDFTHAISDEVRAEYQKQKFEKDGWNPENEKQYLSELHKAHEQTLHAYDHLKMFKDDPQNQTKRLLGNPLTHLFGRGADETRQVNGYIGMVRGENQAIENGWGKDELSILGAIGSIEENAKKYAQYGSKGQKEGMEQFQADFAKLKNDCYHTRVNSAEAKLVIANKVQNFLDTHDSPFARSTMSAVRISRKSFDHAHESVRQAAERERMMEVKPGDMKKNDPIGYLKGLEQEAAESGDLSTYVREYIDIKGTASLAGDKKINVELDDYWDGLCRRQEYEFFEKVEREVINYSSKNSIAFGQAAEQLAKDIREGREAVDPSLESIKGDYMLSKRLANRMMEGGELDKLEVGGKSLKEDLRNALGGVDQMPEMMDEYLKNAADGLSSSERRRYLTDANDGISNLGDIGAEFDAEDPKKVRKAPEDQEVLESLKKASNKMGRYIEDFTKMTSAAKEKFEELDKIKRERPTATWNSRKKEYQDEKGKRVDPKKCNSQSFMNMYNALKDVSSLTPDSSPMQVQNALSRLDAASKAYQDKLESQTFSAWSKNGKARKSFATELQNFAKGQGGTLTESARDFVGPRESILEQANRVQKNLSAAKAHMKENQAQNAPKNKAQEKKVGGTTRTTSFDALSAKLAPKKETKQMHERRSVRVKSSPVKNGPGMGK